MSGPPTADKDLFWSVIHSVYTEWRTNSNNSWGDVMLFLGGEPSSSSESTPEVILQELLNAYLTHTPMVLKKDGTISIFINSSTEAALAIVSPLVKSSPYTIDSHTYTFTVEAKHRRESKLDADKIAQLLGDIKDKQVGVITDTNYLSKYSQEIYNQFQAHCKDSSATVNDISLSLRKKFKDASIEYEKIQATKAFEQKEKKKSDKQKTSGDDDGSDDDDQDEDDEDDDDDEGGSDNDQQSEGSEGKRRSRRAVTKTDAAVAAASLIDRDEHRKKLAEQKNEEAKIRIANRAKNKSGDDDPTKRVATSYNDLSELPSDQSPTRLYVDLPRDSVLFPINGQLVPFHISTVKNITHETVGDYFLLNIEFVIPTARKFPPGSLPQHNFIRNLQYRTKGDSLAQIYTSIKSLQTEYKTKIKSLSTARALVEQPRLQMLKNATVSLRDVHCRPQVFAAKGKGRAAGVLTSHLNGFKYIVGDRTSGGVFIDIIYENIKSCYLQRADRRANIIIMHFELIHPILIRKDRSTKYLQFFIELTQESHDLTRTHMHDREAQHEEEEEERRERQRRKTWNERFAAFAHETEEQWTQHNPDLGLEFELPIRRSAFTGIVSKEIVDVTPTQNSLIALEAVPPLVTNLAEVECVSLERVGFGLREFDMVFIFKDFSAEIKTIASIPMTSIDVVRNWLHDSSLLYFESKVSVNWRNVLDDIRQDELGFYEDGGWLNFLLDDDEFEDDEDEDAEGDEGTGGAPADGGSSSSSGGRRRRQQEDSESDFELEEDESESDSFTSDSDEDDEDDYSDADEEASSGADWDTLEKQYEEEDRHRDNKANKKNRD